jgi:hypothetical protein
MALGIINLDGLEKAVTGIKMIRMRARFFI